MHVCLVGLPSLLAIVFYTDMGRLGLVIYRFVLKLFLVFSCKEDAGDVFP